MRRLVSLLAILPALALAQGYQPFGPTAPNTPFSFGPGTVNGNLTVHGDAGVDVNLLVGGVVSAPVFDGGSLAISGAANVGGTLDAGYVVSGGVDSAGGFQGRQIGAVTNLVVTPSGTGGTLTHSTSYCYRITSGGPQVQPSAAGGASSVGETAPNTEVCATTPAGADTCSVVVTWTSPQGALWNGVYGRSTGAELWMGYQAASTQAFTDTGSVTPAGALPTANLSGGAQIAGTNINFTGTGNTTITMSQQTSGAGAQLGFVGQQGVNGVASTAGTNGGQSRVVGGQGGNGGTSGNGGTGGAAIVQAGQGGAAGSTSGTAGAGGASGGHAGVGGNGSATLAGGTGGQWIVVSGSGGTDNGGGQGPSGNVFIDVGASTGTLGQIKIGTGGADQLATSKGVSANTTVDGTLVNIGTSSATTTTVGRSGQTTNINGNITFGTYKTDWSFASYDPITATGTTIAFGQAGATSTASTLQSCNFTPTTAPVGTGTETIELCNGTGITSGNCTGTKYATVSLTSGSTAGTPVACTVNTSAVAAAANPTWIITASTIATTDGVGNAVAHFSQP